MRSTRWPHRRRRGAVLADLEFSLVYDGDALADGRIPVRDLAPSILAAAQLFRDANALLYPNGPEVQLEVQANRTGSFAVVMHLVDLAAHETWEFLGSDAASRLGNLFTFVGGGGLIGVIIWARNRRIDRQALPDGRTRLTTQDGDSLDVPAEAADLYVDRGVRRDARDVVEPLRRQGVDEIRLRRDDRDEVTVQNGDVDAFDVPDVVSDALPVVDQTRDMGLLIATPQVEDPRRRWRFSEGDNTFSAVVEDEGFIDRVLRNEERFGHGDFILAEVHFRQYRSARGLETERTIVRVKEHSIGPVIQQPSLFDGADSPADEPPEDVGGGL